MTEPVGAATGAPLWILRAEGLALLLLATVGFAFTGVSPWLYVVLFLAPDVSMGGYLMGPRAGAAIYNACHTTIGPMLLALGGAAVGNVTVIALAATWAADVGLDRALGYGLKYPTAFQATHLGRLGRPAGLKA